MNEDDSNKKGRAHEKHTTQHTRGRLPGKMSHHRGTFTALSGLLLLAAWSPAHASSRPLKTSSFLRGGGGDDRLRRSTADATVASAASADETREDAPLGPSSDLVTDLPGYGPPPFPQYSGFLDASAAEPGTKLHYWFARSSADDWATKPTVLWLNGGPGSSSILGFLQENGPLLVNRTGGLMRNPWAWTTEANMIALESPAGVGYSYCAAQLRGGSCANTDNSTARAALAGLLDFFQNKFPSIAANEFYVTGESYAGVYVPTLSRAILDHNDAAGTFKINLAGLAAGDPCTDNALQADSMDMLWYGHKHGFVPEADFDLLWNTCKVRYAHPMTRGRWSARGAERSSQEVGDSVEGGASTEARGAWRAEVLLEEGAEEKQEEGVHAGYITGKQSGEDGGAKRKTRMSGGGGEVEGVAPPRRRRRPLDAKKDPPACVAAHRRFLIASSDAFSQDWKLAWLNDLTLYGPSAAVRNDIPGTLDYQMSQWMMRQAGGERSSVCPCFTYTVFWLFARLKPYMRL